MWAPPFIGRLGSVPTASDVIASCRFKGLQRGPQISTGEALERVRPDLRGDGVTGRRDDPHGRVGPRSGRVPRDARPEVRVAGEQRATRIQDGDRAQVDRQGPQPCHGGFGRERGARHRPRAAAVGHARDNARVTFTRIAWLVTVLACLITCAAMLLSGYQGYAALVFAVGVCAAINLR
jgi:hypothetical protein